MKTKLVLIAVACLLLSLTTSVSAQNNIVTAEQANIIRAMNQQMARDSMKQRMASSLLDGNDLLYRATGWLMRDDFREGVGVSPEQNQKIQEGLRNIQADRENDPNYQSLLNGQDELRGALREAVIANAPPIVLEEMQKQYLDLRAKMLEMQNEKRTNLVSEILTPDQIKRIYEFHISTMSVTGFVSSRVFEFLDISEEQKKQLDEIRKEMELEIDEHLDKIVEYNERFDEKFNDGLTEKMRAIPDQEGRQRLLDDIQRRLVAEFLPVRNELAESGERLSNSLKIRMFDVLTDEQWARVVDLIDNPPDYVKSIIAEMRERNRIANANAGSSSGGWVPGPGSWRPGDAIPIQYRQERETRSRFPRGE